MGGQVLLKFKRATLAGRGSKKLSLCDGEGGPLLGGEARGSSPGVGFRLSGRFFLNHKARVLTGLHVPTL